MLLFDIISRSSLDKKCLTIQRKNVSLEIPAPMCHFMGDSCGGRGIYMFKLKSEPLWQVKL